MTARRSLWLACALAGVVLAAAAVRVGCSGTTALRLGRVAIDSGRLDEGIERLGHAARWYLPVFGAHRSAREDLLRLASRLEEQGDAFRALVALRHVRGAVLGSRWLLVPDADLLAQADVRIALLMAEQDAALAGGDALDAAGHLALLRRDASPSAWRSALVVLLFLAWVAVLVATAWHGLGPDGRIRWKRLAIWGGGATALLVSWLLILASL